MYKIDNIIICLDLSEMDESLINYANFAVETFKPKKITFIHVMDTYEIPEEISESLSELEKPIDEIIIEEIKDRIDQLYTKSKVLKPDIVLEEGATTEKIVNYARKNNVDLAIMGKKIGYIGEGGVVKNIVGLIPSSVLLITETTPFHINKIMVRTNFAKPSAVAFEMAKSLKEYTNCSIEFHHVYKLPYNYFPGQSQTAINKLTEKLKPYMKKQFNKFTKKYSIDSEIPFNFTLDIKGNEAQTIYNYAIKHEIDLVITGTKLKSKLANVIMDSTSEKLAEAGKNIPVMIVKDVKDSVGFLKALFD